MNSSQLNLMEQASDKMKELIENFSHEIDDANESDNLGNPMTLNELADYVRDPNTPLMCATGAAKQFCDRVETESGIGEAYAEEIMALRRKAIYQPK